MLACQDSIKLRRLGRDTNRSGRLLSPMPLASDAPTLLITAGPTHEPIDAVRFIGNRSSGRLGATLASEAARRGFRVTLLMGPVDAGIVPMRAPDTHLRVERFHTTADLQTLLEAHLPGADALVMAAAVADFRPVPGALAIDAAGKLRREPGGLTLRLEATPDLLAACAARARGAGTMIVGFALEPRERLRESALGKLARKGVDAIVANPLETMDAPGIEAEVFWRDGASDSTGGVMRKEDFAGWLIDRMKAHGAWRGREAR